MIEFDNMLSEFEDVTIFKLVQQLLKLIKKLEKNKNIKEWKRHVRSLQIYYRFNDNEVNKSFRIFYDEKDFSFKNSSLRISEGNSKARKNKNSKKISILITSSIVVKDLTFKAFKNFKMIFFFEIKKDSRVLRRS